MGATALYGLEYPAKAGLLSLYGFAFQYADKKMNGGKYTGLGLGTNPEVIQNYKEDAARGGALMDFMVWIPKGYGNLNGTRLPNIQETEDPGKVFTAGFNRGQEVW